MDVEVHFGVKKLGVIHFIDQSHIPMVAQKLKVYSDIVEQILTQVPFLGLISVKQISCLDPYFIV